MPTQEQLFQALDAALKDGNMEAAHEIRDAIGQVKMPDRAQMYYRMGRTAPPMSSLMENIGQGAGNVGLGIMQSLLPKSTEQDLGYTEEYHANRKAYQKGLADSLPGYLGNVGQFFGEVVPQIALTKKVEPATVAKIAPALEPLAAKVAPNFAPKVAKFLARTVAGGANGLASGLMTPTSEADSGQSELLGTTLGAALPSVGGIANSVYKNGVRIGQNIGAAIGIPGFDAQIVNRALRTFLDRTGIKPADLDPVFSSDVPGVSASAAETYRNPVAAALENYSRAKAGYKWSPSDDARKVARWELLDSSLAGPALVDKTREELTRLHGTIPSTNYLTAFGGADRTYEALNSLRGNPQYFGTVSGDRLNSILEKLGGSMQYAHDWAKQAFDQPLATLAEKTQAADEAGTWLAKNYHAHLQGARKLIKQGFDDTKKPITQEEAVLLNGPISTLRQGLSDMVPGDEFNKWAETYGKHADELRSMENELKVRDMFTSPMGTVRKPQTGAEVPDINYNDVWQAAKKTSDNVGPAADDALTKIGQDINSQNWVKQQGSTGASRFESQFGGRTPSWVELVQGPASWLSYGSSLLSNKAAREAAPEIVSDLMSDPDKFRKFILSNELRKWSEAQTTPLVYPTVIGSHGMNNQLEN